MTGGSRAVGGCALLTMLALLACRDAVTAPEPQEVVVTGPETVHGGIRVHNTAFHDGWFPPGGAPAPGANRRFLTIEMEVINLTSATRGYDERSFQTELSDGTRWGARNIRQPALGSGDLRPSESARGWITYEVPMGPRLSGIVWLADSKTTLVLRIPNFPK